MIDLITNTWNQKVKERIAFLSSFISGMIVHLFMLANKLPNHDDLYGFYQAIDQPASGRWFLKWPAALSGDFSITFNGVLAILYVAIASAALVYVLKIKNNFLAGMIGVLMVVFPTITCTLSYMAWVDAYAFALAFAVVAVCFGLSKNPLCWLVSAILLTLSMGIYQAYFPFAAAVFVLLHIIMCLKDENTNREIILSGVKCVCILLVAMIAYLVIVKITTMSEALTDYGGINTMGQLAIRDIPLYVEEAYRQAIGYFLNDNRELHYSSIGKLVGMAWLATLGGVLYLMKVNQVKDKGIRCIICVLACALLPLASGLIYVMVAGSSVHLLMIHGYLILILFPIVTVDMVLGQEKTEVSPKKTKKYLIGAMETIVLITCFTLIFNYSIRANQYYLSLYMTKEQSTAFNTALMTQIKDKESYNQNTLIILAGPYKGKDNVPWRTTNEELNGMTGLLSRYEKMYSYAEYLYYFQDNKNPILYVHSNTELEELTGVSNWSI